MVLFVKTGIFNSVIVAFFLIYIALQYDYKNQKHINYIHNQQYNYQYRIGYVKGNDTYNSAGYDMWGKVLISTTNSTTLRSVAK